MVYLLSVIWCLYLDVIWTALFDPLCQLKARNSANDADLGAVLYTGECKEYITLSKFSIAPEWAANGFLREAFLLI